MTSNLPQRGHGGARSGAGRPRNASPHIIRSLRNEPITMRAKYKVMPLDYLLSIVNSSDATKAEKFEAAKVAAPFMHQRLSAVVLTNDGEQRHTLLDLTKFSDSEVADFERLLTKAQLTSPAAPLIDDDEEARFPSYREGED
ncbi:MAG TPA: hypothetical protein VE999_04760 [Gemmataceae bacterium]|nr:hypothetical protein [Gemmataceae bacterium]